MTTQLTITTPTDKAGQLAYFTIEFLKAEMENVLWHVDLLVSPKCVKDCEEMGIWKIK